MRWPCLSPPYEPNRPSSRTASRGTVPRIGDLSAFPASRSLKSRPAHRGCPKKVLEPVPLAPFNIAQAVMGRTEHSIQCCRLCGRFSQPTLGCGNGRRGITLCKRHHRLRNGVCRICGFVAVASESAVCAGRDASLTVGSTGRSDIPSGDSRKQVGPVMGLPMHCRRCWQRYLPATGHGRLCKLSRTVARLGQKRRINGLKPIVDPARGEQSIMIWFLAVFAGACTAGGAVVAEASCVVRPGRALPSGIFDFFKSSRFEFCAASNSRGGAVGGQVNRHFTALCIYLVIRFQLGGQAILRHRLRRGGRTLQNLRSE